MQGAATVFCSRPLYSLGISTNKLSSGQRSSTTTTTLPATPHRTLFFPRISATPETSTVDYSSSASVFPAEACDTIGGEACEVEMFPEVKPPAADHIRAASVESVETDRDYLEYNEPKTVFPGEACDDLGGEFCEPEYQEGVYQENKS